MGQIDPHVTEDKSKCWNYAGSRRDQRSYMGGGENWTGRLLEKWELLNSVEAFVLYDHKIKEEIRTDYTEFKW